MTTENIIEPFEEMFNGICDITYSMDGTVSGLRLCEKNSIITHAGSSSPSTARIPCAANIRRP